MGDPAGNGPDPLQAGRRQGWVDAAKAISITLVVLYHTGHWLFYAGIAPGRLLQHIIDTTDGIRMPTFFFASGLFATKWVHERSWRSLVNRKIALLSWAFLTWQIMMFVYKYAAARLLPDQRDDSLAAHVLRVLVAPIRPNAELWFLWALVVFFVAAKALRNVPSPWLVAAAATGSLVWSGVVSPLLGEEGLRLLGGAGSAPMYFVFFVVAERYRGQVRRAVARVRRWQAAAVLVAWAATIGAFDPLARVADVPGATFAEQVFGVTAGIALALLIAPLPAVRYLGRNTLPVYLTHTSLIVFFAIAWYTSGAHVGGPVATMLPWLVAAGVILVGLALHRVAADTVLFRPPVWFAVREKDHRI